MAEVLNSLYAAIAYFIIPIVLLLVIRRLLLHPLSKYPGPLLARLTHVYGGWYALRKRLHLETYANFDKYGPVVRQGPDRLVFNTPAALHDIYSNSQVVKGGAYRVSQMRSRYPSLINVIDRSEHRRKRRVIGPVLTEKSMRTFEPTMLAEIDVFLDIIRGASREGGPVDMSPLCKHLGADVIGMLAFGVPFGTQTSEELRFIPELIDDLSWRINVYMQLPALAPLEQVLAWIGAETAVKFRGAVASMIQTRTAEGKDARHDLYSMVADHVGKDHEGLYEGELWPEAILFIMAGAATVAAALSAVFFYLSRNARCLQRLANEIRSTFVSLDEIRGGPQLSSCKYLRACIDEAMRMSSPATTTLWREQASDDSEPLIVDGHVIPRGTQVGISLYSLFHNEDIFPASFTFLPERWLRAAENDKDMKTVTETTRKAFAPFLLGDRSCAGRSLAALESTVTIARTMWLFDFESAPGDLGKVGGGVPGRTDGRDRPGEFQLEDIFSGAHKGPNLVFRERDHRNLER